MDIEPGIYRPEFGIDSNFTLVPNELLRDDELPPAAKFLLIYLLSHKVGYQISDPQIIRETGFGREALRTARKQLQEHGYLVVSRIRKEDKSLGGYRYEVADPKGYFSTVGSPTVGSPTVANPPDNRKLLPKNTNVKKTNLSKPLTADDYNPSQQYLDTLASKYEGLNIQEELEKFRDYHAAKGSKFDIWDRAFQRWVRQAWEWSPAAKEVRARRAVEEELERYKRENGVE
jgi:biotin operon repressor